MDKWFNKTPLATVSRCKSDAYNNIQARFNRVQVYTCKEITNLQWNVTCSSPILQDFVAWSETALLRIYGFSKCKHWPCGLPRTVNKVTASDVRAHCNVMSSSSLFKPRPQTSLHTMSDSLRELWLYRFGCVEVLYQRTLTLKLAPVSISRLLVMSQPPPTAEGIKAKLEAQLQASHVVSNSVPCYSPWFMKGVNSKYM